MKTIALPELSTGETYAGIVLNEDGTPSHHLILLLGDNAGEDWQTQIDWAKSIGGELPTRREQSLLFGNSKEEFESAWYWSSEEYSSGSAWCQYFDYGIQLNGHKDKDFELRARAVRRLKIAV